MPIEVTDSNLATSPARIPSRVSTVRIAKSRSPTGVARSQLATSRTTHYVLGLQSTRQIPTPTSF